jgi:hypothetical protein
MHSLILKLITASWVVISTAIFAGAQSGAAQATASISGKVTLAGEPFAGAQVLLTPAPTGLMEGVFERGGKARTCKTDNEGRYTFANVAAGSYTISVFAPALVQEKREATVTVADEDAIDGIDFGLRAGGVITGRVALDNGSPVIGQVVNVEPVIGDKKGGGGPSALMAMISGFRFFSTDDRGIYRVYGLPDGEYIISANAGGGRHRELTTYYPGVADKGGAVRVKVKANNETAGIDFKLGSPKKGFQVRGRVIDESGAGVPGVMVQCSTASDRVTTASSDASDDSENSSVQRMGTSGFSGQANTTSTGEFKIEGVPTGKYTAAVMTMFDTEANFYGDPASFEVNESDLTGVQIKTHKGLTASGIIVIEGNADPTAAGQLSDAQLFGVISGGSTGFAMSRATINPDGTFTMTGLQPGKLQIAISPMQRNNRFSVLRLERNGARQDAGIEIAVGNPVSDIQVVVGYGNCTIYGRASVQGGTIPKGSSLSVSMHRLQEGSPQSGFMGDFMGMYGSTGTFRTLQVAAGGNYKAEALVPGDYEVTLSLNQPGRSAAPKTVAQKITIASGAELQLDLTLDLTSNK